LQNEWHDRGRGAADHYTYEHYYGDSGARCDRDWGVIIPACVTVAATLSFVNHIHFLHFP
jgi:hypothetical protein